MKIGYRANIWTECDICDKKQPTSLFQQNIFSDNFGKSSEKYRLSKEV